MVGTRLDITEDDQGEPGDASTLSDEERSLWAIYQFTTAVQHEVVEALSD